MGKLPSTPLLIMTRGSPSRLRSRPPNYLMTPIGKGTNGASKEGYNTDRKRRLRNAETTFRQKIWPKSLTLPQLLLPHDLKMMWTLRTMQLLLLQNRKMRRTPETTMTPRLSGYLHIMTQCASIPLLSCGI